jgi:mRNA interferase HigB
VRIVKEAYLKAASKAHPRATGPLTEWVKKFKEATFRNAVEMKMMFPIVDPVIVKSGRTVYVFNLRRNEFRLIAAIHFNRQIIFTLRFLTHAEYDQGRWKQEL